MSRVLWRVFLGGADLGEHRWIDIANPAAHDGVRELVDEDVFSLIARAGIAEKVFFGVGLRITAEPARSRRRGSHLRLARDAEGDSLVDRSRWA